MASCGKHVRIKRICPLVPFRPSELMHAVVGFGLKLVNIGSFRFARGLVSGVQAMPI